jgi:hypothetical protein
MNSSNRQIFKKLFIFAFAAVLSEVDCTIKEKIFIVLRGLYFEPTSNIVRPIFRAIVFVL